MKKVYTFPELICQEYTTDAVITASNGKDDYTVGCIISDPNLAKGGNIDNNQNCHRNGKDYYGQINSTQGGIDICD